MSFRHLVEAICVSTFLIAVPAAAQERAFFVTYDHYLEEPGNLEIAVANTSGFPKDGHSPYSAPWIELEYGVTGWWTTELYLEGVTTRRDGSGFTGWRWEHRFRPLKSEHRVNPVLYIEYESINEASRIQKEIVGSGPLPFEPIDDLRREHQHEMEAKLILSSVVRGWNVSKNLVFEKNGIEAYGGLGSTKERGLSDTRHFLAPVLAWHLTERTTLKVSTGVGLTEASDRYLVRVGWAYEFPIGGR